MNNHGPSSWDTLDTPERLYNENGVRITYTGWDASNSRVVSGPLGRHKFTGRSFRTKREARCHVAGLGLRIVEEYPVVGRWVFRVAGVL